MQLTASPVPQPVTAEDIARRLGLQPLATYRHSGRTTRMLCHALATVASGQHVLILGHSTTYTLDLVRNARRMAHACGLDGGLISAARQPRPLARTQEEQDYQWRMDNVLGRDPSTPRDPLFIDHYLGAYHVGD